MKLVGKIIITGTLKTLTGLHIGGSKSSLSIGNIDNSVIKTALDKPYIPGSSIKGKLRSLLARVEGSLFFSNQNKEAEKTRVEKQIKRGKKDMEPYQNRIKDATTDEDVPYIMELFGYSGDSDDKSRTKHTRLLVRDAFLKNETIQEKMKDDTITKKKPNPIFKQGYTDSKWENVIDRITGTAEHPRQLERVPVGAEFGLELVYSIYEDAKNDTNILKEHLERLLLALQLLQDDGIGGSISRGYGQVKVIVDKLIYKLINEDMTYEECIPTEEESQIMKRLENTFSPQPTENA